MREQTRYRLIGAVFLLAIGIIVLPMVFDGEGVRVQQLPEFTETLPPVPSDRELSRLEIDPAEIQAHREEQELVGGILDADGFHAEDGTRLGDPRLKEVGEMPKTASDSTTSGAIDREPPERSVPVERPLERERTVEMTKAPTRRAPAVPANAETSVVKQAIWAVQLASFASPVNATALRDRLLGDGFEAWTSTARRDEGVRTRVAIGPLLDRSDAERMRDLVSTRYNVSAIVVHMEP